jgi:hypothetical protein
MPTMELMKLNRECHAGRKADESPVWSGSTEDSISSKQRWTSGTTVMASFMRFALTTGIFTFLANRPWCRMGSGTWFHFARRQRNADTCDGMSARLWKRTVSLFKTALFNCYFRALLRLTRQMLNARVQHLPEGLKKLNAGVGQVLPRSRRNSQVLANIVHDFAAWAWLVSGMLPRR